MSQLFALNWMVRLHLKECERSRDEEGSGDEGRVVKMGVLGREMKTKEKILRGALKSPQ